MSDEQREAHDSAGCQYPLECTYHALMAAKVRAVQIDGEMYVNAKDAAHWLRVCADHEGSQMMHDFDQMPGPLVAPMVTAAKNHHAGNAMAAARIEVLDEVPIEPYAKEDGLLVDPHELKNMIPDAIPADWTKETE